MTPSGESNARYVRTAVELERNLAAGVSLEAIATPPGLPVAAGKQLLGRFDCGREMPLRYERFRGADVIYGITGGLAVGSPQFVTGYLLGSVAKRALARRRAKAMAAPQWRASEPIRSSPPSDCGVT
jgi:hypothetical protein